MKMISIDPGTITCGVAVWDIDDNSFLIKHINTFTIILDAHLDLEFRLDILYNVLSNTVKEIKPLHYVHESAFINRFRPQAYGPIFAAIIMIRKAYLDFNRNTGLFKYPPKSVKAIMDTGDANKLDMLEAVKRVKELSVFLRGDEDEHQIDAMSIGYVHLLNIRAQPELLLI